MTGLGPCLITPESFVQKTVVTAAGAVTRVEITLSTR
jgi:hypothetical protein